MIERLMDRAAGCWSSEKVRFLITGGFNTLSSYAVFALLFYTLSPFVHYMAVLVIVTVANVSISFVSQKFVVFRSDRPWLAEYFRFYGVYAVPISLGFVAFPVGVELLHMNPYLLQALITCFSVVVSYLGHKRVSFATSPVKPAGEAPGSRS